MEREREQKGEKHIKLTQHPLLESSNNYQRVLDPKMPLPGVALIPLRIATKLSMIKSDSIIEN